MKKKIMGLILMVLFMVGCSTNNDYQDLNLEIERLTQENETLSETNRALEVELEMKDAAKKTATASILDVNEVTLQDSSTIYILTVRVFQSDEFLLLKSHEDVSLNEDQVYTFTLEDGYITNITEFE